MEDPQNHGFRVLKSLQFWMIWGYPKIRKAAYIYIYIDPSPSFHTHPIPSSQEWHLPRIRSGNE